MTRLALLVVLATCVAGCGPGRQPPAPREEGPIVWIQAEHVTPELRARALRAWDHHRASWSIARGKPAPTVHRLELWGTTTLPSGHLGYARWDTGVVQLVIGPQVSLPLAYHELCHLEVHDPDHTDPRWTTTWVSEQTSSVASFLALEGP